MCVYFIFSLLFSSTSRLFCVSFSGKGKLHLNISSSDCSRNFCFFAINQSFYVELRDLFFLFVGNFLLQFTLNFSTTSSFSVCGSWKRGSPVTSGPSLPRTLLHGASGGGVRERFCEEVRCFFFQVSFNKTVTLLFCMVWNQFIKKTENFGSLKYTVDTFAYARVEFPNSLSFRRKWISSINRHAFF